jgi:hypothetical protein
VLKATRKDIETHEARRFSMTVAASVSDDAAEGLPALADLVSAMTAVPSTNGWDVVCSYTTDQLNAFLSAQYDADALQKLVTIQTTSADPLTGEPFTIAYRLLFAAPSLSFIAGVRGVAAVDMPILDGSTYTVSASGTPPKTTLIPGGQYVLKATVPLAAISGDGTVSEAGNVITFTQGDVTSHRIVLHFANEKGTTFEMSPSPDSSQSTPLDVLLMPLLLNYFQTQVSELDYSLAGITNQAASGSDTITPVSFVFTSATFGGDGVLSLYIQVAESQQPPGDANPSFQPAGRVVAPIPTGHTASLILSYELVTGYFLTKELTASGLTPTFQTSPAGVQASLSSTQSIVAPSANDQSFFESYTFEGLDVPLSTHPLTLTIADGTLTLKWQATLTSTWTQVVALDDGPSGISGVVDVTVSLEKSSTISAPSSAALSFGTIEIAASDISVNPTAQSCSFWDRVLDHCSEDVPAYYSQLTFSIPPQLTLSLPNLDLFATTNLLSPGQNVLTIDTTAGLHTPHDFLLVGQVVAPQPGT